MVGVKMKKTSGFTIVELLVVIVVIAILAAVAIVSYSGIQNRARIASTQMGLSTVAKKLELHKADNDRYPTSSEVATYKSLLAEEFGDLSNTKTRSFIICTNNAGSEYAIVAWAPIQPSVGGPMYYTGSKSSGAAQAVWQTPAGTTGAKACGLAVPGVSMGAYWSTD